MESEENIRSAKTRKASLGPTDDPAAEVAAVPSDFLPSLARVLEHLCSLCERTHVSRFDAVRPPQISIADYLARIQKYFDCSGECFVLALVYLDRIVKLHPQFVISKFNIHRLIVTSVMLAAKFFDDVWYSNEHYAKVGGVPLREMNALEAEVLRLLRWSLTVMPEEYEQYMTSVLSATVAPEREDTCGMDAEDFTEDASDCGVDRGGASTPTGEGSSSGGAPSSGSSSPMSDWTCA